MAGKKDIVEQALKLVMGEGEEAAKTGIRAYHGSPHDFDKFDMSKIGTGEGAQSYGHGLYFAEAEPVAKGYRDALTDPEQVKIRINDKNIPSVWVEDLRSTFPEMYKGLNEADQDVMDGLLGTMESAYSIQDAANAAESVGGRAKTLFNQRVKPFVTKPDVGKGSMYEVNIAADPNTFLDWDKPLSEQPESVRNAILATKRNLPANAKDDLGGDYSLLYGPEIRPGQFLNTLEQIGGRPDFGENLLRDQGIPGIKYLDAGSRGAGDGTRNYVVFDDKLISTIRKYGIAGASAMLGYNFMENLDPSQAKAAFAADQEYKSTSKPQYTGGMLPPDIEPSGYVSSRIPSAGERIYDYIRSSLGGDEDTKSQRAETIMNVIDQTPLSAGPIAYDVARGIGEMAGYAEGGAVEDEDSWLSSALTLARNAADKATFGTSKYGMAGADYLTDAALDALGYENDADFDRSLAEQEYAMKEGEEKQPAAAAAGNVVGYVAPYLAIGPAEGALTTLGYLSDYGSKIGGTGRLLARALGYSDGGEVPEQGYLETIGTNVNRVANPIRRMIGVQTVDLPEGVDEVDYEELVNLAKGILDQSMLGFGGADPHAKRPKKFPVSPTGKIVDRVIPEDEDVDGAMRIAKDVGGGLTPEEVGRRAAQDPATFDAMMEKYAVPDRDIAEYEALKSAVEKQPQDIQQMTHVGAPPMRDVKVDMPLFGGEYNIGSAPYNVAQGMSGAAQTAYDFKTAPLYMTPMTAPIGAGLDVAEGVATGDPLQASMAALGAPGKMAKGAIIGLSNYAMDPAEAQAGKERFFSKLLKTAEELPMEKMTGQQALAMLRKGTSPEELRWTGTEDFLANTPQVTKQNLIDYINKNRVQTEDVVLGGSKPVRRDDVVPSETAIASMKARWDELVQQRRALTEEYYALPYEEQNRRHTEFADRIYVIDAEKDTLHAKMVDDTIAEMGGLGLPTKFKQHSTPGGQNYEETLITLPKMPGTEPVKYQVSGAFPKTFKTLEEAERHIKQIQELEKAMPGFYQDIKKYPPRIEEIYKKPEFWEGHWDRSDVLAHVRSQILDVTPPGANRPFKGWNADEFQSKWGQEGRDLGFAKEIDPQIVSELSEKRTELMFLHEAEREKFIKSYEAIQDEKIKDAYKNALTQWDLPNALKEAQEARRRPHEQKFKEYKSNFLRRQDEFTPDQESILQDAFDSELEARVAYENALKAEKEYKTTSGVSRAPYVTSTEGWTDLSIKKALDKAIDSGSDFFTWTPGEVHAKRYNLRSVVDEIQYDPKHRILFGRKDGRQVFEKDAVEPDKLGKYVGKEMASKLLSQPTIESKWYANPRHVLSGNELEIGGEGMINYYNNIVPKRLEEIIRKATGKKPKIETITVQTANGPRQQLGIRLDDLRDARFSDFNKGGRVTGGNTYGNDKSIEHALALTSEY